MMLRQTFIERWEPLAIEMQWVIGGRPNKERHQKILPEYCYNVFDFFRRTLFKGFTPISEVIMIKDKDRAAGCKTIGQAKEIMTIDWEKLGSVMSIGDRSRKFFENEAEQKLKQDGLLDLAPAKQDELYKLLFGDRWLEKKTAELQGQVPDKSVEEILVENLEKLDARLKTAVPDWLQKAGEWSPEAVTKFHAGAAKGSAIFLDKDGELKGETKLAETYWMLLIAWLEIDDMIKAQPPKRMNDLWDWLAPFSYAGWIEIKDLDQLISICRPIKLKIGKSGAPRKVK